MNVNPRVFVPTAVLILLVVGLGVGFSDAAETAFETLQRNLITRLGWFYVVVIAFFLIFLPWLYVSRFGRIRLGRDDERPTYRNWTWFAMLFSAGMGIGLLFFGVSEPIQHFIQPPEGPGSTVEAAKGAMDLAFLHWGLHAWAVYAVVGLSLAYVGYRHGLPLTIRSTLYPILGNRINGWAGDIVDIAAVLATIFGIATSLGLGAIQVNAGLQHVGLASVDARNQVLLIGAMSGAAAVSAGSGLDRGVRRLSQINILLAISLAGFVLVVGPTVFLLSSFIESLGHYLQHLPGLTLQTDAFRGSDWQAQWTMFYWGWWISWSPFVGMFIARISRGRTIRSFIGGVLVVPTGFSFIWFVVFGNTAIHTELFGNGGIAEAVSTNVAAGLFALLESLPFTVIAVSIALIVIAVFFVTSADSGALVIDRLTTTTDGISSRRQRALWPLASGAIAIMLLLGGGLTALQTAVVSTALPFAVILLFMCRSLVKGLRAEELRAASQTVTDVH